LSGIQIRKRNSHHALHGKSDWAPKKLCREAGLDRASFHYNHLNDHLQAEMLEIEPGPVLKSGAAPASAKELLIN
jgi:hypothetical protein